MICAQCPRACHALRDDDRGQGVCAMPARAVVARAAPHFWEEPVLSGTAGAGAVFFSGCALGCVYCQNAPISHRGFGKAISRQRLSALFRALAAQGCCNIDLVNPTHFAHLLPHAIADSGVTLPFVWNSGGYDTPATVRAMAPHIQIWLPDLKTLSPERGARYCRAGDYPAVATAAIKEMFRHSGPVVVEDGLLRRGVLIRHLLLPGGLADAKAVMDWVAAAFPPHSVLFSLMGQYLPLGDAARYPEIDRTLRPSELRHATEYMAALGLDGFTQEAAAASEVYLPPFDLTGVDER